MHSATATLTATNSLEKQPPTQRIDMRALKQGLEKITAEIQADEQLWSKIDSTTGIVWRGNGIVVSKKPCGDESGHVWVSSLATVIGAYCGRLEELALKTKIFDHQSSADFYQAFFEKSNTIGSTPPVCVFNEDDGLISAIIDGKLPVPFMFIDAKSAPPWWVEPICGDHIGPFDSVEAAQNALVMYLTPSNEERDLALNQLAEKTLQIALELDDDYVDSLRRQSDAGDPASQFLLYEILKDKDSRQYNQKVAANLLKKSAYQGYSKACTEFLECSAEGETGHKLLAHLHSLGLKGNETAYIFWAATVVTDIGKNAEDRSYPELATDTKVKKEIFQVLRRASRNGNSDATWALYVAEKDTTKAAKLMRLAAKQGRVWANYLLACCLMTGACGQPKDLRKASKVFLNLYRINNGRFPGEIGQQDFYFWAYACMEIGIPFPQELSNALNRLRIEPESDGGWRSWSTDLLDALREYAKSRKTELFREVIILGANAWTAEGPMDGGGNEPGWDEFYESGKLDIERNLLTLTPAYGWGGSCEFPGIIAKLRPIANKGIAEVQYILGLLGDTKDDWLARASDGGFALASYHLGFCRYANQPESALRHLKKVAFQSEQNQKDFPERFEVRVKGYDEKKEVVSEELFLVLRDRSLARIREIEAQLSKENARRQTERDMLSYLSHTLNSLLASGPETARQAIRDLGTDLYENNREYNAINNIAAMLSTFLFAQQLLKTFKLYIADPDTFRKNWTADHEGPASISMVTALALRQTLSHILFSSNQDSLQRLLPPEDAGTVKTIRKSFMREMIPLDISASNAQLVFDWVGAHLPAIRIDLDPAAEMHFDSNSTRFTFFFASFSELIYNALKYSDAVQPIEIRWRLSDGDHVFRCANNWSEESMSSQEGSQKGLEFLARFVEILGAKMYKEQDAHRFAVEIRLPSNLI